MMANIREMTIADFERKFSDARVEEVIKMMQAVKSVTRDRVHRRMNEEGCKEYSRTINECIFKLEDVVNKYLKSNS